MPTKKSTRPHPVVAKFIAEGGLMLTQADVPGDSGDATVAAIIEMQEALDGHGSVEGALRTATDCASTVRDPNLGILYFGLWANLTVLARRESSDQELAVMARRALASVTGSTPPEIRAAALNIERLRVDVSGNWLRAEEVSREIVDSLPSDSSRRPGELLNLANVLALSGKESEVDARLSDLLENANPRRRLLIAHIRAIDATETGRGGLAARYVDECRSFSPLPPVIEANLTHAEFVIALMEERPCRQAGDSPSWSWATVTQNLLERRPGKALKLAHDATVPSTNPLPGFAGWSLIRAELSCGHADAARRLLDERRKRGSVHYLDDLFLARVELLAGRKDAAARHFAAVRQSCERYGALGRLDFELRLACELSPLDLVSLGAASEVSVTAVSAGAPSRPPSPAPIGLDRLVGCSPATAEIRTLVSKLATLDVPVLITGETGTGKELVARAIHEEGPRREEPFVAINCGAVAESLIESELFGHERGAFTGAQRAHRGLFEEAGTGTIFLDEIGEVAPRLQVSLLRVLESGEFRPVGSTTSRKIRCRVLAATNARLDQLETEGKFRKDLLYRLRRMEVRLLPLRERRDDILPLAEHFLALDRADGRRPAISEELQGVLLCYAWPGNVRELRNEMERMRLLNSEGLSYGVELLGPSRLGWTGPGTAGPSPASGESPAAKETEGDAVRELLAGGRTPLRRLDRLRALFREHGKLTRGEVARVLGVSPETATRDLKALHAEGLLERIQPTASPRTHYFRLR